MDGAADEEALLRKIEKLTSLVEEQRRENEFQGDIVDEDANCTE